MALIYHYCSPQTFLQIIERQCIWLSSTNNMNDSAEGEWFAKALKMVLKKKMNVYSEQWCDDVWRHFVDNTSPRYIACFSKRKDSLSQWRAYAQDGEGVAIGFDEEKFGAEGKHIHYNTEVKKSLCLCDAEYYDDLDIQDDLIQRADELRCNPNNDPNHMSKSSTLFASYCTALSIAMKNPAFEEEDEKRLVYSAIILKDDEGIKVKNPIGDLHHRISNGFLTSYFEYNFPVDDLIKEIILGPKNKFQDIDMRSFLAMNSLGNVGFSRSTATYR